MQLRRIDGFREMTLSAAKIEFCTPGPESPLLSVIIPVYNEAATVAEVVRRVACAAYRKEIIVMDDGSGDATWQVISDCRLQISDWKREGEEVNEIVVLRHERNRGKGAAIRSGLAVARGEYVIIQDADLEYDPAEYPRLVEPLVAGEADVVYGSRYLRSVSGPLSVVSGQNSYAGATDNGQRTTDTSPKFNSISLTPRWSPRFFYRCGIRLLNWLVFRLYGVRLTDEATCYKAFRTADLLRMELTCEGFEFCPEVTAKACRLGLSILEVPISYSPRGRAQGKKIRWRDGIAAVRELWQWRKWRPAGSPLGASLSARPQAPEALLQAPARREGISDFGFQISDCEEHELAFHSARGRP